MKRGRNKEAKRQSRLSYFMEGALKLNRSDRKYWWFILSPCRRSKQLIEKFVVAGVVLLAGCMSHEQGLQMHREIREHEQRISDLEAGRNEPAPPEWQAWNGDGR